MKFYKFDIKALENELNTDADLGLSDKEANVRYNEFVKTSEYFYGTEHKIEIDLSKSIFFVLIAVCVYFVFAIFNKNLDYVYLGFTYLVVCFFAFAIYSVYIKYINKRFLQVQKQTTMFLECIRNGTMVNLRYDEIVFGDVVFLKTGDFIPFDARVIDSKEFAVDESKVTRKNYVYKSAGIINEDNINAEKIYNTVFCGSYVVKGSAKVLVTDIGKRVYINKALKQKHKKIKVGLKISDVSRLLIFMLLLLSSVFSVVTSFISKDYINAISISLTLSALFSSGIFTKYISLSFVQAYIRCAENSVHLKSLASIEKINSLDVLLLNQDIILDRNVKFTGFIPENGKYTDINELAKNNFQVFMYSALCGCLKDDPISEYSKKMMKKIHFDFSDIESVCPLLSESVSKTSEYMVSARTYEGNNILIARGNYKSVLKLCEDSKFGNNENLKRLLSISDEVLAVAVKRIEILPVDLLNEKSGYVIVGFIGVKRKVSDNSMNFIRKMETKGVHSVILYSGSSVFADSLKTDKCVSASDFNKLEAADVLSMDLIYNYSGNYNEILDHLLDLNLKPGCFGKTNHEKVLHIESYGTSRYESKDADIICDSSLQSVYDVIENASNAHTVINTFFEVILSIFALYIISGTLFSILFKKILMTAPFISLLGFIFLPFTAVIAIFANTTKSNFTNKKFAEEPIQTSSIVNAMIVAVSFVIAISILKLTHNVNSSGSIILIALTVYLSFTFMGGLSLKNIIYLIPVLLTIVLLSVPFSKIILNFNASVFEILLGVILGSLVKTIIYFKSRSEKN